MTTTRLLASVATLDEAATAGQGGADIIDLKAPAAGALGAWRPTAIAEAVRRTTTWPIPAPLLSATIGDLPMDPLPVADAVARTAALGVDIVKVGLWPEGNPLGCIRAIDTASAPVVAVLFADLDPDLAWLPILADTGFRGVMLDTAGKTGGSLRRHLDGTTLARFVTRARGHGLVTGLAGSLGLDDIPALLAIGPDYLGFRGALCVAAERTARLDATALARIRAAIPRS